MALWRPGVRSPSAPFIFPSIAPAGIEESAEPQHQGHATNGSVATTEARVADRSERSERRRRSPSAPPISLPTRRVRVSYEVPLSQVKA